MKENHASTESLAQRLRALQNMTVANGCTESEALVAAAKAAELLERYGLSLTELKAAAPDNLCDSDTVKCGRRHTHEAQFLAPNIAQFTNTKVWLSRNKTDVQLTFFGLKADVQIACCPARKTRPRRDLEPCNRITTKVKNGLLKILIRNI